MKEWALFIGIIAAVVLVMLTLLVGGAYYQKWIHSPECHCECGESR